MDTMEAIMGRKSIRRFTDQPISQEDLETILKAGMAGPSAVNARPWQFIVVRHRDMLCRMAERNGHAAAPLCQAQVGILVCGDMDLAYPRGRDYWVVDGSIACQNMLLAAHDLGIGSVWLGTWPQSEKVAGQKELFSLPESIVPHSILAFGYAAEDPDKSGKVRWEPAKIHYEKW